MAETAYYTGTGRRKSAVAQVRLVEGKGLIRVNGKPYEDHFGVNRLVRSITAPFAVTGTLQEYDAEIKIKGGGPAGQAGAAALGIARALSKIDRQYHQDLRKKGFLTRDARKVERKKAGCHKARRGKQFSKR